MWLKAHTTILQLMALMLARWWCSDSACSPVLLPPSAIYSARAVVVFGVFLVCASVGVAVVVCTLHVFMVLWVSG